MSSPPEDRLGPQIFLIVLAIVGFVALVGGVAHLDEPQRQPRPGPDRVVPAPPAPSLGLGLPRRPAAQELAGTRFTVQTNVRRIVPVSTAVPASNASCSSAVESI